MTTPHRMARRQPWSSCRSRWESDNTKRSLVLQLQTCMYAPCSGLEIRSAMPAKTSECSDMTCLWQGSAVPSTTMSMSVLDRM